MAEHAPRPRLTNDLIAAAPDMLLALEAVQRWAATLPNASAIPDFPKDEVDAAVMKARP